MPPRVAVLGAGTMAPGIAAAFAAAGHEVLLWSRRPERTAAALARAAELARFLAEQDLAGEPAAFAPAGDLAQLATADVVVEAIAEDLAAKRELLAKVDAVLPPEALLATNTSGLRVTD